MAGDLAADEAEVHVTVADRLPAETARRIAAIVSQSIDERGSASVALAGGNTPRPVYAHLAALAEIAWDRVRVFFGDERAVPPDDADSNYRMVLESLVEHLPEPPAEVQRMRGELPDLDAAAREYAAILPEPLDLVILGIGADGHTASLFPGGDAVRERRRRVVPVTGPKPPHRRLTVTPPVIEGARRLLVIAAGDAKATAVARAVGGDEPTDRCPARLARRGIWCLDLAAAAALPGRQP